MSTKSWDLVCEQKPFTINSAVQWHRMKVAGLTKEWRGMFWLLAAEAQIPRLGRIEITVTHELRTRMIPDIAACALCVKAGIDGLVDAGVIPDDDPEHMTRLTFLAPVVTGRDALVLSVRHVPPVQPLA